MDPPPITLIMVKGPRKGETIGFQPGSTVRIGRVVRGNNVPIKDAGVSSKHLTIESQSGKWVLRDLGSSNGTTLNSNILPADAPFDLNDGDLLKLGESASILIKFEGRDGDGDKEAEVEAPVVVAESRRRNPPRRGKALKNETVSFKKELENLEFDKKENVGVRVTRSRKNEVSVNCGLVSNPIVVENLETEAKRTKAGRPRGRKKIQPEDQLLENETNLRDEVVAEAELNPSRYEEIDVRKEEEKSKDSKTEVKESCVERVEVNLENQETKAKRGKAGRLCGRKKNQPEEKLDEQETNLRDEVVVEAELELNLSRNEEKVKERTKAGRPRGRKKIQPEDQLEENETNLRDEVVAEAVAELNPSRNGEIDVRKEEEKSKDSKTEVKESCVERVEVNLENQETKAKRGKAGRLCGKKKNQPEEKLDEQETNLRDEVVVEAELELNLSRNEEKVKERTKAGRPRGRKKIQPEDQLEENETNLRDEVVAEAVELNPSRNGEIDVRKEEEKSKDSKTEVKESCVERVEVNLENQETKAKRGKAGCLCGRKKNQPEEKLDEQETNLREEVVVEAELELNLSRNKEKVKDSKNEVESCDARIEVDLEKMTLKDWFDYLEVHLPKTIIESTEEMMEGMRNKADRVQEYMMEQKMKQGKAAMG